MTDKITALKVRQWLSKWDEYDYNEDEKRSQPEPYFYLFKLSAPHLKTLSGIQRRTSEDKKEGNYDPIQRPHDKERSETIRKFVRYGYPFSELSKAKQEKGNYDHLKKPGWLPTAIIINILGEDSNRKSLQIYEEDRMTIEHKNKDFADLYLPESYDFSQSAWEPKGLPPIEVIDGQHRLWAFENDDETLEFELPVVAFYNLDISWQAYLFWSINITPKKINPSLAYDLYPLLRNEEWLEETQDNYIIYRRTRAQELVDALWSIPSSPWYHKIDMLGEKGKKIVTQSAFINSLIATFLRGKSKGLGGLFSSPLESTGELLNWNGTNQAAFLIFIWKKLLHSINNKNLDWIKACRDQEDLPDDEAFFGKASLLKTDQGVRGYLFIVNDLVYISNEFLDLEKLFDNQKTNYKANDEEEVNNSLKVFESSEKLNNFITNLADNLSYFDWRTKNAPGLSEDQIRAKNAYRGSGGYKVLRIDLLDHLMENEDFRDTAQFIKEKVL